MADLNPWYLNYPLAKLKVDPKVKEDFQQLAEKYKASTAGVELTDEQLEKFDTDVKEWESAQGFKQVHQELASAKKNFIYFNQNKSKFTPEQRAVLGKKINDQIIHAQGTDDMYARSEETRGDIMEKITAQNALHEDDRTIDVDKSMSDLSAIVLGEDNVRVKNRKLNNFKFTTKAKPIDLQKTYSTKLKEITTGQEGWQNVEFDPATGITTTTGETGITGESLNKLNKKLVNNLQGEDKRQYMREWEADKEAGKGVKSFEDWMKRYLPVSLIKKVDKETQKGTGKTGIGPPTDESGNVEWTKPITDMKDPLYGENAVGFKSTGSLNLNNLFPKTTSFIYLPITKNTVNPSTGETEEGFVGENFSSLPISADFYSEATEDIKIDEGAATGVSGLLKRMGIPERRKYFVIPKGGKISEEKKKIIDAINKKEGRQVYHYKEEPYLLSKTRFKQVEISDEYDIKSFGRSTLTPYFDVRERLITLPGFKAYDEAIMKMYNELNGGVINEVLGGTDSEF